jgi:hypothetical protein
VKKKLIILFIIGFSLSNFSQALPHFFLGEKELAEHEIYGITQDQKKNLWITTDNGLIKYDGYTFKAIPQTKEIFTSSFFTPQVNSKGDVFCANLIGDILKVENDTLKIHFKDPTNKKSLRTYFKFTKKDKLLVLSSNLYLVDSSLSKGYKTLHDLNKDNRFFSAFISTSTNESMFYVDADTIYAIYIDSSLSIKKEHQISDYRFINGIKVGNKIFNFEKNIIFKRENNSFIPLKKKISQEEKVRFETDGNLIWVLSNEKGAFAYNTNLEPLFNRAILFKDFFVSTVFKDKENNILLGTFNNGIIVVPNLNVTTKKQSDFYFSNIECSNERLFASTNENEIVEFDENENYKSIKKAKNKISFLLGLKKTNSLLYFDDQIHFLNFKKNRTISHKYTALKDAFPINKNNYLLAEMRGVQIRNFETNKTEKVKSIKDRTFHVSYDSNEKIIYAGTINGLKIGVKDSLKDFKYNNQLIIVNDITLNETHTYIASKKNGILVFKGDQLITKWGGDSLFSNVKHIKLYKKQLYAITDKGLYVINIKTGNVIDYLSEADGYFFNDIIDLEIWNNKLWSISRNGMQIIALKNIHSHKHDITIKLDQLKVNDSIVHFSKVKFDYTNTKFAFTFSSPTIKYKDEVFYKYKLSGIDENWQNNNYTNNSAIYKSLPPGKYTFAVKAVWRRTESSTVNYNFIISPPYWKTWWFYLLIGLIFIVTTILIAHIQITKQKSKNKLKEELNLSKLIAIQSQMNPHFIFNAINSIQDLILHGGVEESYDYVVKFSQLVRQTLTFSNKEFIYFSDEISLLSVYLEIEKLRFKNNFEYEIKLNNIKDIEIPPMLIQPFVENAIKHGLLHKEGTKMVSISFELKETLICTIIDNGIGREASAKIKERQKRNYESFSTSATARRFDIMKEHYEQKVGFVYYDLKEQELVLGTKVILNMPYKLN